MHKLFLFIFLIAGALTASAQKTFYGSVKGSVMDTASKQSMQDATISLIDNKDSSSIAFTTVNKQGSFEIKDLETGSYRLLITFQGYQNFSKKFTISPDKPVADLGTINMDRQSTMLEEVIVERPPINIKKDTVEYNASSFKTKPNATVEDLLKKLPGVQVDREGNVKAQGENIQKVYVDGKEFFGTDPKLATKNLTADMVESVQVFDDMSDQAKFTRIDDGSRAKTMNIKLKKDKKNGYFGKLNAGIGTDSRYDGNLSFNRFNGSRQISVIAAVNNTNKQGFSFSDIISTMGGFGGGMAGGQAGGGGGAMGGGGGMPGGGQMVATRAGGLGSAFGFGGGNSGITSSISSGVNYRDAWGKKIDVSGSYFYSRTKNVSDQDIFTETRFIDDSTTFTTRDRQSENINGNHRFNMRIEYRIDSMNSILYTPSLNLQHSEGYSNDTSFTNSVDGMERYLALTGKTYNENNREGISLNNNLLYRRRLSKIGRTFTLGWSNTYNHSDGDGKNISPQILYKTDGTVLTDRLSQNYESNQITNANNNVISSSYTEPLGNNKLFEVNYAYTNNQNNSDKHTNNFNQGSGKYDIINAQQTNFFENSFVANRIGGNFRVQQKKYNYQLGASVQFSTLESQVFNNGSVKDSAVKKNYTNFTPNASFNYNPKMGTNLRFNYRGRTNQPSTTQLQNVLDVSNPQNIRTGNPELKQEFSHNLNLGYNTFKLLNFQFMAVNFNAGVTQNKIVNSLDSLSRGVQLTRPVNMNGAFNASAFFTYGKTTRKLKGGNFNATTFAIFNRDVSMLYKQKNSTANLILTQTVGINYNHKALDMGINASLTYNNTSYRLQPDLNAQYYMQTYSADFSYTFLKSFIASTDFDYTINSGLSNGFNQNIPYWNGSLSWQVFKKKDGEIKLAVFDILNQNKSVTRMNGENYIQDTRSNVLKRYFMLSFVYNLRKGSAPNNQMQIPKQFQKTMRNMRIMNQP
ncbi:MAG: TonB-dependent receptor [Gemmatimonadaceae bacterium]|nr:TonB-dependent receptor [Chitinophagaceae bacterium]